MCISAMWNKSTLIQDGNSITQSILRDDNRYTTSVYE